MVEVILYHSNGIYINTIIIFAGDSMEKRKSVHTLLNTNSMEHKQAST